MTSRPDLYPQNFKGIAAHFTEECGEALTALGKLQRFGSIATDPKTGIVYDNVIQLERELNDVIEVAKRLCSALWFEYKDENK